MKILVIGAGYIGLPLTCSLKNQGHQVTGWVASEPSRARLEKTGVQAICANVTDENSRAQRTNWDAIVYCVSSSRQGLETFTAVHQRGLELALKCEAERFLYISSTSVYGQNDGSEVNENSPTHPISEKGKILLDAEQRVQSNGGIIARVAGIYGPERGFWFQKIMSGAPVLEGNGERWLNQIHRDDVVNALSFLLHRSPQKELWNVCDDEPVRLRDFCQWVCETAGKPLPTFIPPSVTPSRGKTNKRVSNAKLRAAAYRFLYPTFREGYSTLFSVRDQ